MRSYLLLFFSALLTWSCGAFYGESTAPTFKDIPGSYALVTYDGNPLPYHIDSTLYVSSDTLFLHSDGAYEEIVAYGHIIVYQKPF